MEFTTLIRKLKDQHNVLEIIDLSPFFAKNGKTWLYTTLKRVYKETYNNDDRLIFYFKKDQYLYKDNLGSLVVAFQQFLAEVDISHYFVVLITEDERIKQELYLAQKLYATDDVPIFWCQADNIICEVTTIAHIPSDTKCVMPWVHLYIAPDTEIYPCCHYKRDKFSDMKPDTILEIMNGDGFKTIRTSMLNNERVKGCELCYNMEDNNLKSFRVRYNETFPDVLKNIHSSTNSNGSITSFTPRSLNFGFHNTCNFKCRMCTGESSSMIAQEEETIHNKIVKRITTEERARRFNIILQALPSIEHSYFTGGEPLLIKEHYQILDYFINHSKDVNLEYNSNLSLATYKGIDIVEYWNQFKNVTINASLDANNKHAEYMRSGTIWDNIEKNYCTLRTTCEHVNIVIASVVTVYNAFNVTKFHKDWIEREIIEPDHIKVDPVLYPSHLSVQILPTAFKQAFVAELNDHITFLKNVEKTQKYYLKDLIGRWEDLIAFALAKDTSFELNNFFKHTDVLDFHRKEKFEETHLEYSAYLRKYIE